MPKAKIARITTRKPQDGRARSNGELEVCANGERVAIVAPRGEEFFFYFASNRLPTRNTLGNPVRGVRTWPTREAARDACVTLIKEELAARELRADGGGR